MPEKNRCEIKPEVLAAITTALTVYSVSEKQGYRITNVRQIINPWKKCGIIDNMLTREIEISWKGII